MSCRTCYLGLNSLDLLVLKGGSLEFRCLGFRLKLRAHESLLGPLVCEGSRGVTRTTAEHSTATIWNDSLLPQASACGGLLVFGLAIPSKMYNQMERKCKYYGNWDHIGNKKRVIPFRIFIWDSFFLKLAGASSFKSESPKHLDSAVLQASTPKCLNRKAFRTPRGYSLNLIQPLQPLYLSYEPYEAYVPLKTSNP